MTAGNFRYVSIEREKEWVKDKMFNDRTDIYLAICLNDESKRMIGYTSLNNIDYTNRKVCGGGIVIGEKEFRDGIILMESMLLLMSHCFDIMNMTKLYGKCLVEHTTSNCMLQSLKWMYEGTLRKDVYKLNAYHDVNMYSILRDDYYEAQSIEYYIMSKIIKRFRIARKNIK